MKTLLLIVVTGLLCVTTALASPPKRKKMKAFTSERELQLYFHKIAEKQKAAYERQRALYSNTETVEVSASVSADESVTNTQVEGVDEGGIVKVYGDYLVLLRRGRLFTVRIGEGALRPVSAVDAFGPDIEPRGTWYDEMLISGNTIVVIGYSYDREGTEVGLFNIDTNGHLSYRSTYHLRSNDYYSSRNYASRLIGTKLIFYSPLHYYGVSEADPLKSFPSVRKWHKGATTEDFHRIVSAKRIYRPDVEINVDYGVTLHTVTICDLANGGFDCQATSVIGPPGNVFYVSPESVYVWTSTWNRNSKEGPSVLFRMPLDGSSPGALRVSGSPVDQFSFLESEDHFLNVLVRSDAHGDGMWKAEAAEGDVALMRVPLWSFSDGAEMVPATSYRELPKVEGYFQNRFVGDYLLYGTGNGWAYGGVTIDKRDLYVVDWANGNWQQLEVPHGVDRIEQMGKGAAVVIGSDGKDLHFTSIRLDRQADIVSRYTREGASQGELRSHGFFYKPDGDNSGTLGLPISRPGRPGFEHLFETSAAILFLRNDGLTFRVLGELEAQPDKALDDKCRASCIDWYGNARPLFLRGRMFALLGYELVEGKLGDGGLREVRRVTYAPTATEP
jgi:hypothetical protein